VAAFIASLKVAVIAWLIGTAVAPFAGVVEITVGAVVAGTVLKVHEKLLPSGSPVESVMAVVRVAVYKVLVSSRAAGVNVATAPVQPTVPATAVPPGPLTRKLAIVTVAQFNGLLKVALRT